MKTSRSKISKSQEPNCFTDHSTGRDSRQMMLAFANQVELREISPVASMPNHTASTRQLTQYSSVKRISLVFEGSLQGRPCLTSTEESLDFFKQYWAVHPANDQERFVVACLDTKHRVQCVVVITIGTLDASLVHPREVFKPAFIEGSSAIVLSHNHPSGNPDPSREDRQVTDRLTEAGQLLGIIVLDHIIHGDGTGQVLSIRENS
jgi:DNA repair protein RadC